MSRLISVHHDEGVPFWSDKEESAVTHVHLNVRESHSRKSNNRINGKRLLGKPTLTRSAGHSEGQTRNMLDGATSGNIVARNMLHALGHHVALSFVHLANPAQHDATRIQQCCVQHVASVWPGLNTLHLRLYSRFVVRYVDTGLFPDTRTPCF